MATGRRKLLAGAFVVIAAGAAITVAARDDPTALERAMAEVDDAAGFGTGVDAGETLARVSQHLEVHVADCRADAGDAPDARCAAGASALGYAQVLAAWVLDCTDPGRHEARTRMAAFLGEVAAVARGDQHLPSPPDLPVCG